MNAIDRLKLKFLKELLPKSDWAKEELAKLILPRSPHSIFLGWDDVDMSGKLIRRVGTPVRDDDVARKKDVEEVAMPVGDAGDMIYHNGTKWTALDRPATEKWLKHPGGAVPPEWADVPAASFLDLTDTPTSYAGQGEMLVRVKATEDGLEFTAAPPVGMDLWATDAYILIPNGRTFPAYFTIAQGFGELADGQGRYSNAIYDRASIPLQAGVPIFTHDKRSRARFAIRVRSDTAFTMQLFTHTTMATARHLGFKLMDGYIYGSTGLEAETAVTLQPYMLGAFYLLEWDWYPGEKCDFYVDGVLQGTSTTNLPDGAMGALFDFYMAARIAGVFDIFWIEYWQAK